MTRPWKYLNYVEMFIKVTLPVCISLKLQISWNEFATISITKRNRFLRQQSRHICSLGALKTAAPGLLPFDLRKHKKTPTSVVAYLKF